MIYFERDHASSFLPSIFLWYIVLLRRLRMIHLPGSEPWVFRPLALKLRFRFARGFGFVAYLCWFASQTCVEIYKADGHSRPKTPAASPSPDKHHKINTAASPATASTDKTARTNVLSSTASSETCGRISDNYRWEWFPFGGLQTKAETLQSSEDPPI